MRPELTMNLRNNPEKLRAVGRIFWKNINRCIIHESLSFFQNSIERRQLVLWSLAALAAFLRRQTSSARIRQIVTVLALMTSATGQRQFGIIVKMLKCPRIYWLKEFCILSKMQVQSTWTWTLSQLNLRLCFASVFKKFDPYFSFVQVYEFTYFVHLPMILLSALTILICG